MKLEDLSKQFSPGDWSQVKGEILKQWQKLSPDDLEKAKGNVGRILGLVQEKYGIDQEKVRSGLDKIFSKIGPVGSVQSEMDESAFFHPDKPSDKDLKFEGQSDDITSDDEGPEEEY